MNDLKFAVRQLLKNPGFTAVAVLTLALGIGANTAIFSVVHAVLLSPLPFRDPDRLMMMDEKWLPRFPHFEATPKDFLSWQEQNSSFGQMAAFAGVAFNLTDADRPERISGARVSANLPSLLGVKPLVGRSFTAEEDKAGKDRVVLLSHGLWQRRFGGDPQVVGTAVTLNGVSFTIVGIMPPTFRFPQDVEIWKPMGFAPQDMEKGHFIWAIGRLKPDVTRDQAQAEMDAIMPRLQQPQVWSANVIPLMEHYVGDVRLALSLLLGAAALVLLIACANVANLLLLRASVRQKELSLRASLGASRGRIIQQLLTETLLMALLGGALGLLLAFGGISFVKRLPLAGIPRLDQASLDYPVLLFTLAVSALTGVLFGLLPALRLSRTDLADALKTRVGISATSGRTLMRNALVVSELSLALVLLAGSGLLLKSFWRLNQVRPGFNPEKVLTAKIDLPALSYGEPHKQTQFVEQLLQGTRNLPETRGAAVSTSLPFSSVEDSGIRFDGRSGGPMAGTAANHYRVTPLYLQTMQIPLIRGRLFTDQDTTASRPVVLINETMARRYFPDEDPIGKRLDISGPTYMREIVGIVGDVKQEGLRTPTPPQVYEPFLQKPSKSFFIVVRGVGDAIRLAEAVRQQALAADKYQPISDIRTLEDRIARSVTRDWFSAFLLGLFAILALVLAAVGIYGVMAYSVTQKTQEIGIRIALGAHPESILRLVLGQSLRTVLLGLGIGLAGSIALTRVLGSLLYEVKPRDPVTIVAVAFLLFAVALVAAFTPARRAAHVDPMVALRTE